MMSLTAAAKAGALCVSLLSPDVNFCVIKDQDYVCTRKGCQREAEMTVEWRKHPERQLEFFKTLYGYEERK